VKGQAMNDDSQPSGHVTGRGEELLAELAAADAVIAGLWDEWDTRLCVAGGSPQAARNAWYDRLTEAQADRQAVAARTWAYFEDDATVAEKVAWVLMDPRWGHSHGSGARGRSHGSQ
jgi:hypothetical protein